MTNDTLQRKRGSETWTLTLYHALKRLPGVADVALWSPMLGPIVSGLNTDPDLKGRYDVALVNHNTCLARAKAVSSATICTVHGTVPQPEQPVAGADLYVSVSEEIQSHLRAKGFESIIMRQAIDIPVPATAAPRQTLQWATLVTNYPGAFPIVRAACNHLKIQSRWLHDDPDWAAKVSDADVIIGIGRCALEAASMGKAVLLLDARKYQGLLCDGWLHEAIAAGRWTDLAASNYSGRALKLKPSAAALAEMLSRYTPDAGAICRSHVEQHHDANKVAAAYLELARKVLS